MKTRRTSLSPIELLVVIIIIILVPSILMASLEAARELAKIPVCANQLRQIGIAIPLYAEAYEGSMPWWGYFDDGDEEGHPYVAYRGELEWMDPVTGKLKAMRLACLYEAGLITEPKMFYCPAMRNPLYKYESYIKFMGKPTPWGFLPQDINAETANEWVRAGYIYYPTDPNDPKNSWGVPSQTATRFDGLDPNIPYLTDMIRRKSDVPHIIQDTLGVNALFKDGHVVYCDDQSIFDENWWDQWEHASDYQKLEQGFYYTIFKLIGQSCSPTE